MRLLGIPTIKDRVVQMAVKLVIERWKDGFLRKVEDMLEGHMGLTVNREKTKVLGLDAERSSLVFLGYEFRKVRDGLFGTGRRYLHFGPSSKSVKRVCREVHELTHSRNVLLPVETVVERVNRLLKLTGKNVYNTQHNRRKERIHGNRKSTRWKAVCGKSARTV